MYLALGWRGGWPEYIIQLFRRRTSIKRRKSGKGLNEYPPRGTQSQKFAKIDVILQVIKGRQSTLQIQANKAKLRGKESLYHMFTYVSDITINVVYTTENVVFFI